MHFLSTRKLKSWLGVLQVLLLLLTSVPAMAANQPNDLSFTQAIALLREYQIVRGDEQGNLNLDKPITRAEMFTIMARTMGKEEEARDFAGWSIFNDIEGHWAKGYIIWAANEGLVKGDGDGRVRPDDPVTYAEAMTLILRLLNLEPQTGDWPTNVIIRAAELGLLPDGVNAGNIRNPAIRGAIFHSMARAITAIRNEQGKTFLQQHLDSTPPVLTLADHAETTNGARITISGTADDAVTIMVNGEKANLIGNTFSADVALEYGRNTITVTAVDRAGNKKTVETTVTRMHPITTLEITGPDKVRPGGTAIYIISAKNANGDPVSLEGVTARVEGGIGTFDLESGTFTAGDTPAKGKITVQAGTLTETIDVEVMGQDEAAARVAIRPPSSLRVVSYDEPMTVQVEVVDQLGRLLPNDYGRPVKLSATGLTGLEVTPAVAYTEGGVATFEVRTKTSGFAVIRAESEGLLGDTRTVEFGTKVRVRLSATPSTIQIGGATSTARISATLVDENGNPIVNQSGSDIGVNLSFVGGNGSLADSYVRIPVNSSSSTTGGDEGLYVAGTITGTITVRGVITTGQAFTVDPTTISVSVPTVGSGTYWDLLGNTYLTPNQEGLFLVRLSDSAANTVPGSYAFKLNVSTSNNEPRTNGVPQGLSLYIGDTLITNTDTILRTTDGVASLKVVYDKPGEVYLTITSAGSSSTAIGTDGLPGVAASTNVPSRTYTLTYSGTASKVKLTVTSSAFGENKTVGAATANSSQTFTLTAYLTDDSLNWIPGAQGNITLIRVSDGTENTVMPLQTTVAAVDGKATFTVAAGNTPGSDRYKVKADISTSSGTSTVYSSEVELLVHGNAPATPSILAIRGHNNGIPGALNYVAPSDTHMEIELNSVPGETWVVVQIYRENGYSPIYTSEPYNISVAAPRILVPKSALPSGVYRYQVAIRNGYGESPRSAVSDQVVNAVYTENITITSAKYQRSTNTLTIYGSGFNSADSVSPALITIQDASTGESRTLAGASVSIDSSTQMTLNLTNALYLNDINDLAKFSGSDVTLTAATDWYTRTNGEQAKAVTTGAPVSPMARIDHVEYDQANGRLYLVGSGFSQISLDFSKLVLRNSNGDEIYLSAYSTTRISDSRWSVSFSGSTEFNSDGTYTLNALDGWAYDGSWTQTAMSNLPIYAQIPRSSVTYDRDNHTLTITGSGFSGATDLDATKLTVVNLANNESVQLKAESFSITGDTQIDILLHSDAYTVLNDVTKFSGSDIYLLGAEGWLTNAAGRKAAPIPERTLRFPEFTAP